MLLKVVKILGEHISHTNMLIISCKVITKLNLYTKLLKTFESRSKKLDICFESCLIISKDQFTYKYTS